MNTENKYFIYEKQTKDLTNDELNMVIDFFDRRYKMIHPNDPPRSNDLRRKQLLEDDPHWKPKRWFVWSPNHDKLIGYAQVGRVVEGAPGYEENKKSCFSDVLVDIDYRRQGIGTELILIVFQRALDWDKTSIGLGTVEQEGRDFFKSMKIGIISLEGGENRLQWDEIDWVKMEKWLKFNPAIKEGVIIDTFEDVPENYIEEYSKLYTYVLNLVPKGEEEWEATVTPEVRRKDEKQHKAKGNLWITKISKEKNGKFSGLTEIFYNEENNYLINQELTGVLPEYRSRGLGKLLKADMLFYIKERFPEINYIITGNADINAPMLAINKQMGFKKSIQWTSYKFVNHEMEVFIEKNKS